MPGSGQWRMITNETYGVQGDFECWVCDKQIYTLIFWNEMIGFHQNKNFSQKDINFVRNKISDFEVKRS